ncbi:hypothetical protein BpHYR1_032091 [Brachionus plicatilis]|uniref:Uncharacterized protein n=1 Tax=Brachionus plicatilis TaxID=10195 RepID=A0A3M7T0K0_BRAPC|nr:hypothetical protein BpHYR1_032091 [Brachionus plicatilis]
MNFCFYKNDTTLLCFINLFKPLLMEYCIFDIKNHCGCEKLLKKYLIMKKTYRTVRNASLPLDIYYKPHIQFK